MPKSLLVLLCLLMSALCAYAQDDRERGLKLVRVSPTGEKLTGRQFLLTIGVNEYLNWPKLTRR
jgi:hypothetical protein